MLFIEDVGMGKIKKWEAIVASITLIVIVVLAVAVSDKAIEQSGLKEKDTLTVSYPSGVSGVKITKPKEGYLYIFVSIQIHFLSHVYE